MKKLLTAFTVCICYYTTTAQEIDQKIREIYADKTQEMVINDPDRLRDLNDILSNRVKIKEIPVSGEDKYPKLSSIPLLNKYNSSLQRDKVFNPETFNPLKYKLDFFPKSVPVIYRVDNTNYVIVIEPQIINH